MGPTWGPFWQHKLCFRDGWRWWTCAGRRRGSFSHGIDLIILHFFSVQHNQNHPILQGSWGQHGAHLGTIIFAIRDDWQWWTCDGRRRDSFSYGIDLIILQIIFLFILFQFRGWVWGWGVTVLTILCLLNVLVGIMYQTTYCLEFVKQWMPCELW